MESSTRGLKIMVQKVVTVSPTLGQFLGGITETSRTHAINEVWEYIKVNKLQDAENNPEIHCDDKLKTLFEGKERVNFREIPPLLNGHFKE